MKESLGLSAKASLEQPKVYDSMRFLSAVLVSALLFPVHSTAQDMKFGEEEAEEQTAGEKTPDQGAEEETQEPSSGVSPEHDVIGDLAREAASEKGGARRTAPTKETSEEIYAVQQIYALRNGRFEIAPSMAFTLNDQYVSHPGVGVAFNYWWTNVLAIGANVLWYQGPRTNGFFNNESDLNFYVLRSTRTAVPITEYQMGAHLNFTYVPLYGKFSMFSKYIFQWDAYIIGGLGFMRTRPIPVFDPAVRNFSFEFRVAFNLGLGVRIFLSRWLAIFSEIRDYAFLERLENGQPVPAADRMNSSAWLEGGSSLTNNVTVHFGLTMFLPFTFDYKLPK